jgi:hypothetical protein
MKSIVEVQVGRGMGLLEEMDHIHTLNILFYDVVTETKAGVHGTQTQA